MLRFIRKFWSPPGTENSRVGQGGEREAERFLKGKGFRVIARNWRSGKDEIDLVCTDEGVLVFVETRTRGEGALVSGYHSIGKRKRDALRRVCRAYLAGARKSSAFRFDVVEVEHREGEILATRHFENAPLFRKETGRGRSKR